MIPTRLLSTLIIAGAAVCADAPIRGFTPEQSREQRERERAARAVPQSLRIGEYIRRMSAQPHIAGSAESKAVAEYLLGLLRGWSLEARIEEFEALLPQPKERLVEMVAPVQFRPRMSEPVIPQDEDSSDAGQVPTYNAYSASGDVTAPLVYVNHGLPEDYEQLRKLSIDVKGKIVIARYGNAWRGVRPKVAAEHGAVGCLIYSDPHEDGYFPGDVYPKGPYRPADGVQRGSVMDMAIHPGDPLSPGWASEKGSKRLSPAQSRTLMKIPVVPISYADAQPLLEKLEGPVAPEPWRGALGITYHIGPGPATVRLKVELDQQTRPLYNVIATIPGSEFPDEWVIYGNHHDAWVNGAQDPVSGAASLLETARTLAELRVRGWKPRRTVVLALWDAEEFGLVGSTEWVEKHTAELERKAVAYLNTDSNGRGVINVGGSHTLEQFVVDLLGEIPAPGGGKNLLEAALEKKKAKAKEGDPPPEYRLGPLGSGSDYTPFIHHAGIASLNFSFSGDSPGGIYHSIYDSYTWYSRFGDPDFVFGKALSEVSSTMLLRLADAPLLPHEFGRFAHTVKGYAEELTKAAAEKSGKLNLKALLEEVRKIERGARDYETQLGKARPKLAQASPEALAKVNGALVRTERALTSARGLPGRDWYRHRIYAPGLYTGYGAKTLPGIREAVDGGRWEEAQREAEAVVEALRAFQAELRQATRLLKEL